MSRINTTIKLEEIDAYIKEKHGTPRGLTLAESDVLRKWTNEIVDVIKLNWPVRTGTSRAAWSAYTKPGPGIEIIITNSMYYSSWVTRKGTPTVAVAGEGAAWWRKLVPRVWRAAKPITFKELKKAIDKTEAEFALAQKQAEPNVPLTDAQKRVRMIELFHRRR